MTLPTEDQLQEIMAIQTVTTAEQLRTLTRAVAAHERAAKTTQDRKERDLYLREALILATIGERIEREGAVRREVARIRADWDDPMHQAIETAVGLLQSTVAGDDQETGGTQ